MQSLCQFALAFSNHLEEHENTGRKARGAYMRQIACWNSNLEDVCHKAEILRRSSKNMQKQGVQKIQRYGLKRSPVFGKYKNSEKLNNFRKVYH